MDELGLVRIPGELPATWDQVVEKVNTLNGNYDLSQTYVVYQAGSQGSIWEPTNPDNYPQPGSLKNVPLDQLALFIKSID